MTTQGYNAMIGACAKKGESTKAEGWLLAMQTAGLQPDEISYNAVIDACAKRGDAARAVGWLLAMQAAGLRPNEISYTAVIDACAKAQVVFSWVLVVE